MTRRTPPAWGKAWSLYRRTSGTDSAGDPVAVFDLEHPDFSASAGTSGAVAWQEKTGDAAVTEPGERLTATAVGCLYGTEPEIAPFDRVRFDNALWEVRSVTHWPGHREVTVVRI